MITIKGNIITINRIKKFKLERIISEICSLVHYMNIDFFRESMSAPGTYDPNDPVWKRTMELDVEKSAKIWFDQYNEEEKIEILKLKMPEDCFYDNDSWEKFMNSLTQYFRQQRLNDLV